MCEVGALGELCESRVLKLCALFKMQKISKFFSAAKPSQTQSQSPASQTQQPTQTQSATQQLKTVDLTDDVYAPTSTPVVPALSASYATMDFEPNVQRSQRFTQVVKGAFGDRQTGSSSNTGSSISSSSSSSSSSSGTATVKLTPLETQVVQLRKSHPDCLLVVECGYRLRFFGDDALAAAAVLGVVAHKDHSFMVASVPTYRFLVHCRRLIAAGHKVGLVRQTETAALRKGSKGAGSSTFSRDIAAVFSPGTVLDDDDPVFADLLRGWQKSSKGGGGGADGDDDDDDDGGDDGEVGDEADGAGSKDSDDDGETWLVSVYEVSCADGGSSISVAAINIQANLFRHILLADTAAGSGGRMNQQGLADYLDMLRPKEVVVCDECTAATWQVLQVRNGGIVKLASGAKGKGAGVGAAGAGAGAGDLPQYVSRITLVPIARFFSLCPASLEGGHGVSASSTFLAVAAAAAKEGEWIEEIDEQTGRGAWLEGLVSDEKRAAGGLHWYLQDLGLEAALRRPAVEDDNLDRLEKGAGFGNGNGKASASSSSSAPKEIAAPQRRTFKLDSITARDLEVFSAEERLAQNAGGLPLRGAAVRKLGFGSLVWIVSHCQSSSGRRTLRSWLAQPFCEIVPILERQEAVSWLQATAQERRDSRDGAWLVAAKSLIASSSDFEKTLASLHHLRISPKKLLDLLKWTAKLEGVHRSPPAASASTNNTASSSAGGAAMPPLLQEWLAKVSAQRIAQRASALLAEISHKACQDGDMTEVFGPSTAGEYPLIAQRRKDKADAEESLGQHLLTLRKALRNPSLQYKTLNTGATSCLEYLVEVPVAQKASVPSTWGGPVSSTKAMLRFHPPEVLRDLDRLQKARDELKIACNAAWGEFVYKVDDKLHDDVRVALVVLGRIDALLSLATLAQSTGYVKPLYPAGGTEICIRGGRHPMAERLLELRERTYISNDATLQTSFGPRRCMVVSGPNMGGKSSYVRATALICLLGQIGAHVPADYASLPVLDQIFTRMGAGDDLASGQSTFMTELYRTSRILQHSTARSLVVLDELGRGTATFDGTAIALATLQHIVDKIGCACLFVTHFPQVSDYIDSLSARTLGPAAAVNVHMDYLEKSDPAGAGHIDVLFLHKVAEGRSGGSFGLNVARLAGMDAEFLASAAAKAAWMGAQGHVGMDQAGGGAVLSALGGDPLDTEHVNVDGNASATGQQSNGSNMGSEAKKRAREAEGGGDGGEEAAGAGKEQDDKEAERKRLKMILEDTKNQLMMLEGSD